MVRQIAFQILALLCILLHASQLKAQEIKGAWATLEECTLVSYDGNDGDSFKVKYGDETFVFRLYFVDTLETHDTYPDRIADQARYFKIQNTQVAAYGKQASEFTKRYLIGTFTVYTKWEDARGSAEPRFYAIVDNGTIPLSQALVANGLARIYGMPTRDTWPGGISPRRYLNRLKQAERDAQRQKFGLWDPASNSPQALALSELNVPSSEPSTPTSRGAARPSSTPGEAININTATSAELESLPGIGPSLASKIIAGRPYDTIEELQDISGIGSSTFAGFSSMIITAPPPPTPLTAEFYLADPETYLNKDVSVRIASLSEVAIEAPETFRAIRIETANEGKSGGALNAFIPEEFFDAFVHFYSTPGKEFTGLFFEQDGDYVLVYRRVQQ